MGLADEYRRNALDCFERARQARSISDQTAWLGMAQLWLQFAQNAEQHDAMNASDAANLPTQNGDQNGKQNGNGDH